MSSDIAISLKEVCKKYPASCRPVRRMYEELRRNLLKEGVHTHSDDKAVLHNVSTDVFRGEIVGVIGRNGAGKSTLLQILTGIIRPSEGTVEINGRVTALLELGSGFNPEFTGRENVYLNAALYGLSISQINERYDQIMEFSGVAEYANKPVKTYSTGMALRLAFAVMAHVDADILVIDEALAVGDALYVQKCMRFLKSFAMNGTIIFVSHDLSTVKGFCTRVVWLEDGGIKLSGEPKEVCEAYLEYLHSGLRDVKRIKKEARELRELQYAEELDMRKKRHLALGLRNDIQVISMPKDNGHVGKGGAVITSVNMYDEDFKNVNWIVGGEIVELQFLISAEKEMRMPIAGFYVKDKLGQTLFGENTYLEYADADMSFSEGENIVARFRFEMPILAIGDYSVTVAIAEGTQDSFEQLHWMQDALIFKSVTSLVSKGLMGIKTIRSSLQLYTEAVPECDNEDEYGKKACIE